MQITDLSLGGPTSLPACHYCAGDYNTITPNSFAGLYRVHTKHCTKWNRPADAQAPPTKLQQQLLSCRKVVFPSEGMPCVLVRYQPNRMLGRQLHNMGKCCYCTSLNGPS